MWIDNDSDMQAGDLGFLIQLYPDSGENRIVIRTTPGRTNMSHERRRTGWLGSTNNTSAYARGVGRVTKTSRDGTRARVARLHGDAMRDALERLGHPDLG